MAIKKKFVGAPGDWWDAWEVEAAKHGVSRDAWIGQCCNANLPKAVEKGLSERPTRGRPAVDKTQDTEGI